MSKPTKRTLQESLNLTGDDQSLFAAIAKDNPKLLQRVTNHPRRTSTLSEDQQELLASIILSEPDAFGPRERNVGWTIRMGADIRRRMDRFCKTYPRMNKTRIVEIALDRLLRDLGA